MISVGRRESDGFIENVSMSLISPFWSIEYLNVSTKNVTVANFLFECASHYNLSIEKEYWRGYKSFFIESINYVSNGEGNRYWQYYVNGEFADVGCNNYFLSDNDVVEWRFEQPRWS